MFHRELSHPNSVDNTMNKTLEREINLAKNIQTKLLNCETPTLSSGEVSGISIPARLIGGDYFDFYPLGNGRLRIVIGDVMGKGIPAAMLMILTRGAFRTAAEATKGPGETLTAMNNAMYKDLRVLNSFVTVFCADWEPSTGTFIYANAGHSLPEIVSAEGSVVVPPPLKGVMLGGLPNQVYTEESVLLSEGDLLFLYTDGIIEAQNTEGAMYKTGRLLDVLKSNVGETAFYIEKAVVSSVNEFMDGMVQKDDITMVTLKVGRDTTEISSFNAPVSL
ncbi:PP2C family protein-serine/threonine phosphatase [Paenibacillus alginolyticus]|uniref:Serine/threonine-protein phosphatase n=1 Tax=Paenibacillus alginolyticus TaxID=59839 RepID=A0ABT4G9T5_9BACL|nr:PP2C family protein-serine/threonine phosphatase [Paenibacillus alginolyticus]MCY9692935.1 serine/threonine-protein phosphatase [Paenibacillus alginolyticus]MEC0144324.1 PP2C family protein-serine/threonine phosphatase [Paenibacillus alginolyticus]